MGILLTVLGLYRMTIITDIAKLYLTGLTKVTTPEGPDVIEQDYVALRTGPDGYASIHEQLDMQTDGTWETHVADVKTRFPKSNTGSTTIGDVPQDILDAAEAKQLLTDS